MKFKSLSIILFTLLLNGCAMKKHLFTTGAVSMSEYAYSGNLKKIGPVKAKYCRGDPTKSTQGNEVGLMDETIYRAQKKKKAHFIKNASFSKKVKPFMPPCFILEGTAYRK